MVDVSCFYDLRNFSSNNENGAVINATAGINKTTLRKYTSM